MLTKVDMSDILYLTKDKTPEIQKTNEIDEVKRGIGQWDIVKHKGQTSILDST